MTDETAQLQGTDVVEQTLTTDLGHLLNSFHVTKLLPAPPFPNAWQAQLLTPSECKRLIQATEMLGYGRTDCDQEHRGNLRLICDDPSLARVIKRRVLDVLPKNLVLPWHENGKCVNMVPVNINTRFRFSKYNVGTRFAKHVDGYYQDDASRVSMLTVNIYLSDDAALTDDSIAAAATRFYYPDPNTSQEVHFDIVPRAGVAVIFQQAPMADIVHEGLPVQQGTKYLMRADVMFIQKEKEKLIAARDSLVHNLLQLIPPDAEKASDEEHH